jgi:hypothetical protein
MKVNEIYKFTNKFTNQFTKLQLKKHNLIPFIKTGRQSVQKKGKRLKFNPTTQRGLDAFPIFLTKSRLCQLNDMYIATSTY